MALPIMQAGSRVRKATVPILLSVGLMVLASCAQIVRQHGYIPPQEDLQSVIVGVDTRDSVEASIGRPSTSGVLREGSWFYIGSKVRHFGALKPKELEREVVAIRFDGSGTVQNIERFGLERGQVVVLSRRVTETTVRDVTFIRQLIRNFGRIDLGEALG
ncbi:outer membrane protein assembly factor BamE [Litoreibacter sp.]|nr:outer membrane protein assembly factor BamE [Litoreibacter sp.]